MLHPVVAFGCRANICERPGVVDSFAPKVSSGTVLGVSLQTPSACWVFCRGSRITTGSVQPAVLSEEEVRWARIGLERPCKDPARVSGRAPRGGGCCPGWPTLRGPIFHSCSSCLPRLTRTKASSYPDMGRLFEGRSTRCARCTHPITRPGRDCTSPRRQ